MTGNLFAIIFLALLVALLIVTAVIFNKTMRKEEKDDAKERKFNIHLMTNDAIFIALIVLMTFVPNVGYLTAVGGVITFTLLHLPVLIGASLMGWKRGAIYGLAFGFFNWVRALVMASTPFDMLFMNPLISILPRFLFGLIAGLLFEFIRLIKKPLSKRVLMIFIGIISTFIHTFLVFGSIYLFTREDVSWLWEWLFGGEASALGMTALALTTLGAAVEAALAAIFVPSLNIVLTKALPNAWPHFGSKGGKKNA